MVSAIPIVQLILRATLVRISEGTMKTATVTTTRTYATGIELKDNAIPVDRLDIPGTHA